ncbi:leucine-rich melanocyte differentiation-associated protein-like isoform X2 [Babylonia areolata]|uniref:leucine-rich melanocyte differentiation-associated protein-like isoform X2 n=1 Tax=Babylonia areolata TaxID=304850 RepID=UPI003FCFDEBD
MAAPADCGKLSSGEIESDNGQDNDPVFCDGQLCYLGHEVTMIPPTLIDTYADRTQRLDLSFNMIQCLSGLERFIQLKELILDNNELSDDTVFPCLRSLTTLCLNKNRFENLDPLLHQLKEKFPQLHYLSLLGNIACPNQLSSSEKDEEDYQRYRYYVLYHLPYLKFLDSSAVQQEELQEARRRGKFLQVVRPPPSADQEEDSETTCVLTPLPSDTVKEKDDVQHLEIQNILHA